MPNTIRIKNSGTSGAAPTSLATGELALNYSDGRLFYKNASNQIVSLSGVTDGDKGDIVVSGSGSSWAVDSSVLSTFGRSLIDDADAATARTTLGAAASASPTFTGQMTVGGGSASSPAIVSVTGTSDTGVFFPAADALAVSTGGVERLRIDSVGAIAVGGSTAANAAFYVRSTIASTSTRYGILSQPLIAAANTSNAQGISSLPQLQDAATIDTVMGFNAMGATLGTGATLTNQYGYYCASTTAATNNYGFYGAIALGTGRWNVYMAGTAPNYFAGNVGIGTASPSYPLHVVGTIDCDGLVIGTTTASATGISILGATDAAAARTTIGAAASSHTHTASDIVSGTLDIARLPTGTTSTTVCIGNDARLSDTRAPTDNSVSTAKIVNNAVTYAKVQNVSATDRLLGRSSAGAGVVEEITCTSFGRSLIDDADASTARTTLGLQYATAAEARGTRTTGSITASTSTLTVASGTGINNGDFVVGEGLSGTVVSGGGTTTLTLSNTAAVTLSSKPVTFFRPDRVLSPASVLSGLCRAWVNFNGSGTVSIRAAFNVSSIADNGVGDYTINFTDPLPDTNYVMFGSGKFDSGNSDINVPIIGLRRISSNPTTQNARIITTPPGSLNGFDCEIVTVAFIR